MYKRLITSAMLLAFSSIAHSDLKPDLLDCDPKKAARNAAMDATVGVSGRCNAEKAANEAKENVTEDVKESVEDATDNVTDKLPDLDNPLQREDRSNNPINKLSDRPKT